MSFQEAFCAVYNVPRERYAEAVFWRGMHRHSYFLARFINRLNPDFFKPDLMFIRELQDVRDPEVFTNELNRYHGVNVRDKNWIRATFGVRVSGKRIIRLKNTVLQELRGQNSAGG